VAKVMPDCLMTQYAQLKPGYGFERHKGYASADHIDALGRLGPLSLHRFSFTALWIAAGAQQKLHFGDEDRIRRSVVKPRRPA
jgi:ribonuclease HII